MNPGTVRTRLDVWGGVTGHWRVLPAVDGPTTEEKGTLVRRGD